MKNKGRGVILFLGDVLILLGSFWGMLKLGFGEKLTREILYLHTLPFAILSILWIIVFFVFELYDPRTAKPTIPYFRKIIFAFLVALALSISFFYLVPFFKITPKTNLLVFCALSFGFFTMWRRLFYNIFSYYFREGLVFIAPENEEDNHVEELISHISTYPQSGFLVLGKYNSTQEYFLSSKETPGVFIVNKETWKSPANFQKLYNTNATVWDLVDAYEYILGRTPIEIIDESWFMHNFYSNRKNIYEFGKRIFSILLATIVLVITSPVLVVSGLLIKMYDGGPIIYSQTRVGKNGKVFRLFKLRSMSVDAEKNGPEWSRKQDSRVTPIGNVLRTLHFDEIPQMLNVIHGDIDLVGPRPERPEFVSDLENQIPYYYLRHTITPGFTGWAQIKFHYAGSVLDSKKKFEYDLYYLKNRNLFMDLGIILRTVQIIFTH